MEDADHDAMHQHRHLSDPYRRIELITGAVKRRRWTAADKAAMVTESMRPGINVSALARQRGVSRALLQTWRRNAMREATTFLPLRIEEACDISDNAAAALASVATGPGTLEIEGRGLRARFSGPVDTGALQVILTHLGRRG
jgi:transposase-like protein